MADHCHRFTRVRWHENVHNSRAMTAASTPLDPPAHLAPGDTNGPFGRIRVVTPEPIRVESNPSLMARARDGVRRRPWIFPAVLLGSAAVYLLVRRR